MIAPVLAVIIAVAATAFAWQRNQALEEARAALAGANSQLQKAQAELRSTSAEVAVLRKESAEQKLALDQQRAELATAKAFLDSERAATVRIREELTKAMELVASLSRPRAAQAAPAFATPQLVRPQAPMVIRAAPGGAAVGAARRAQ